MISFPYVYQAFDTMSPQEVIAITEKSAANVKEFSKTVPSEVKERFIGKLLNYFKDMLEGSMQTLDASLWQRFNGAFSQIVNREYLYAETSEKKSNLLCMIDHIEASMQKAFIELRAELQPVGIRCHVDGLLTEVRLIAKSQLQKSVTLEKRLFARPTIHARNLDILCKTQETLNVVVQALITGHVATDAITAKNVQELFAFGFANDFAPLRKACVDFLTRQCTFGKPLSKEFTKVMQGVFQAVEREKQTALNEEEAALFAKYQLVPLVTRLGTKQGWETWIQPRGTEAFLQHAKEKGFLSQFRPLSGRNAVESIAALFDMLTEDEADRFFDLACRPALGEECKAIRPLLDAYLHRKIRQVLPLHDAVTYPMITTKGETLIFNQRSYLNEEKLYEVLAKFDLSLCYSSMDLLIPESIYGNVVEAFKFFIDQIKSMFSSMEEHHFLPRKLVVRLCNQAMWAVGNPDLKEAWETRKVDPEIKEAIIIDFKKYFEPMIQQAGLQQKRAHFDVEFRAWNK